MITSAIQKMPQTAFGRGFENQEIDDIIKKDHAALMRISYKIGTGEISAKDGAHAQVKVYNQVMRPPNSGFIPIICKLLDPMSRTQFQGPKTWKDAAARTNYILKHKNETDPSYLSKYFHSMGKGTINWREALGSFQAYAQVSPFFENVTKVLREISTQAPKIGR